MKTWGEFNAAVIDLLLVDGTRRGRGVERFRDRMIVAGVRDLQRNIPDLRSTPAEESFSYGELTENAEKTCEIGDFDYESVRVYGVSVRKLPTEANGQDASVYFYPNILAGHLYRQILDGGGRTRTQAYPGRVCFNQGKFYSEPALMEGEILSILYTAEKYYKPAFDCSAAELAESTPFTDDEVLAVHHYVKYHFAKDVDDNQKLAASNYDLFRDARKSIYANRKEWAATANPTSPTVGGYTIPNG